MEKTETADQRKLRIIRDVVDTRIAIARDEIKSLTRFIKKNPLDKDICYLHVRLRGWQERLTAFDEIKYLKP